MSIQGSQLHGVVMREWLESFFKYLIPFVLVVALIIFEAEGIVYSNFFVSVLTASLGVFGISVYGKVRK